MLVKFRDGSAAATSLSGAVLAEVGSSQGKDALAFGRAFAEVADQKFMPRQNPLGPSRKTAIGEILSEPHNIARRRRQAFLSKVEFVVPGHSEVWVRDVTNHVSKLFEVPSSAIQIAVSTTPKPLLQRFFVLTPSVLTKAKANLSVFASEISRLILLWPDTKVIGPTGVIAPIADFLDRIAPQQNPASIAQEHDEPKSS